VPSRQSFAPRPLSSNRQGECNQRPPHPNGPRPASQRDRTTAINDGVWVRLPHPKPAARPAGKATRLSCPGCSTNVPPNTPPRPQPRRCIPIFICLYSLTSLAFMPRRLLTSPVPVLPQLTDPDLIVQFRHPGDFPPEPISEAKSRQMHTAAFAFLTKYGDAILRVKCLQIIFEYFGKDNRKLTHFILDAIVSNKS